MDNHYYRAGEFSRKAAVSIRTLRFYDQQGLLAPSQVSPAGYRLYSDADLVDLQQILALKYLGFSLDEIKTLRSAGPRRLYDVLEQQKAMMLEKRVQLDSIIQAIEETEQLLRAGDPDWDALVRVIQAIRMDQNKEWLNKYFTPEQLAQMQRLQAAAYDKEALQTLAGRGSWTEADQAQANARWASVAAELQRLTASGADPAGAAAQQLVRQYNELIGAFTGGDAQIAQGLSRFWQNYGELPPEQRPFQPPWGAEAAAFLKQALAAAQP